MINAAMTLEEYASFQASLGTPAKRVDGQFWHQVRPFFYRPLLPFQQLEQVPVRVPWPATFGGWQCAVSDFTPSNSALNCLMFLNARDYSLEQLDYERRRQVRAASKHFTVRPFEDCAEFADKAYPVYCSFFARTGYAYKADRRKKPNFDRWARTLFAASSVNKLGAFSASGAHAVSVSVAVGDTLIYSTFFAENEALRRNVSGLMLHTVRMACAQRGDVHQVFSGMRKSGAGRRIDEFLIERGCATVAIPALYKLNPLAESLLKIWLPLAFQEIVGGNR